MTPEDLIGHVLGLLEADERRIVEEMMRADADMRSMVEKLRRRLSVLEIDREHFAGPADLASRTCARVRVLLASGPREQ